MKNTFFIFFVIMIVSSCFLNDLKAQDAYTHAAGLRGGPLVGISYKRFILPPGGVIEGIAGFNFQNGRVFSLTGLYEQHFFITYQLNWFVGAGATFLGNKNTFDIAADAIIGLEYMIEALPINLSLDYKPAYRFFDGQIIYNEFALSIRYIL